MNKSLIGLLLACSSLTAWDDHPDREPDRNVFDSNCAVESGYDWSNRDPDSRDNDQACSTRDIQMGTNTGIPDRDK